MDDKKLSFEDAYKQLMELVKKMALNMKNGISKKMPLDGMETELHLHAKKQQIITEFKSTMNTIVCQTIRQQLKLAL